MTKVTILGEANTEQKKLKPIQLVKILHNNEIIDREPTATTRWDNIILLAKNYHDSRFDLMYAYMDGCINHNNNNCLILGHFNDGIVE